MLLRKDIETIMSTPELWQAFHNLEKAYTVRLNSPEKNARYKAAFEAKHYILENVGVTAFNWRPCDCESNEKWQYCDLKSEKQN